MQEADYSSIIKQINDPFKRVIDEDLDGPVESSRLAQIALAKRNQLYWQGKQYLSPVFDEDERTVDWVNVLEGRSHGNKTVFASVYNIIYSDGIKFMSVTSQRRPNQKCVPDNPDDEAMTMLAGDAYGVLRDLHRRWKIRRKMDQVAFHLWTTGPVFGLTRYVADKAKYGEHVEPNIETEDITLSEGFRCPGCSAKNTTPGPCPECGSMTGVEHFEPATTQQVVSSVGEERYPMGSAELNLYSSLYVQVPFEACDLEQCNYLNFQEMKAPYLLKALYGDRINEDVTGADEEDSPTAIEADEAISEISNPDRDPGNETRRKKLVHDIRHWRPEIFHAFGMKTRKMLLKEFPDGARINRVNGRVVDIAPEKMEDYWSVCKTGTGTQVTSAPLCEQLIPIQDDTNNFFNMARETILRGVPKTFVDSSLIDREAQQKNPAVVSELIITKLGDRDIGKLMGELPRARFPEQLMAFQATIREMSREIGGIMPPIFGGGETTTTWREASQRKNQALMQLQPAFENMQDFVSDVSSNGVKEVARFGIGTLSVSASDKFGFEDSRVIDIEGLKLEGWHVEAMESNPVSFGEKVDRISQVMTENPDLANTLSFHHPMNTADMQNFFGVEGLYAAGEHEREKALRRIHQLAQEEPVATFDDMVGQIETSSIPVDPFEDKPHRFFADIFRAWCNSPSGQKFKGKNLNGFRNVWLHGYEQDMAADIEEMPAPMPGEEAAQEEVAGPPAVAA